MQYYHLECDFIEGEASFSFDEAFCDVGGLTDSSELAIRYYETPPLVWVDQVYPQRQMSDVLKAISYIPHQRAVDVLCQSKVSGVQFIPVIVDIDGVQHSDFFSMNVVAQYPLLNLAASRASAFSERLNGYKFIKKLVFCADKLARTKIRHDIFRVEEHNQAIVVSQRVKDILDKHQISGVICFPIEIC